MHAMQAESELPDVSGLPSWIGIPVLVLIAIGTAFGPLINERVRERRNRRNREIEAHEPIDSTLDYAAEYITDLKRQRDRFQRQAESLQDEVEQLQQEVARLQARRRDP